MEQTRAFLAENRQSMVGIFKRFAKIGGGGAADHHSALTNLTKSYMALVAATDFLEVRTYKGMIYFFNKSANTQQFEDNEVRELTRPKLFS